MAFNVYLNWNVVRRRWQGQLEPSEWEKITQTAETEQEENQFREHNDGGPKQFRTSFQINGNISGARQGMRALNNDINNNSKEAEFLSSNSANVALLLT